MIAFSASARSRRGCKPCCIGFTLIEVLTVIAIIAILTAILIPTAASTRFAAGRTKTRVQFSQWASAVEAFRQEYGVFPVCDPSAKINGGATGLASGVHMFHDVLAGRRRDGSELPSRDVSAAPATTAPENQNTRRIGFLSFSSDDIFPETESESDNRNLVHDAFGNTDIAVLVDRNLDGKIDALDYTELPTVSPPGATAISLQPADADFSSSGVRAGVIFYCAPPKATEPSQLILSWK